MGGFRHDNLVIDQLRHLAEDRLHILKGLPDIFTRGLAFCLEVGDTVQADRDIIIQRNSLELFDGAQLVVQFAVQVFGIRRAQFQFCQFYKVVKGFAGYSFFQFYSF